MIRALTASIATRRRPLFIVAWLTLNAALLAHPGVRYLGSLNHDWHEWLEVPERLANGTLYEVTSNFWFLWSPIAAALLAHVFVPLGYSWWLALHLAALPLLRDWWLIGLTVVSVPFWVDTINGNTVAFVFVAGALALRGSRIGTMASLALFVLMPRPLAAPLVVWLLWKRPESRLPFVVMGVVTLGVSVWTGYLADWLHSLLGVSGANTAHFANLSPTALVGLAWLIVGIPLAAWLTLHGHVGMAGLAMSSYVLPMYPLVLLWEWIERPSRAWTVGSNSKDRFAGGVGRRLTQLIEPSSTRDR